MATGEVLTDDNKKVVGSQYTYNTLAELQAITGLVETTIARCTEMRTLYRFELNGNMYLQDNTSILDTGDLGDTRWIGIAGKYIYGAIPMSQTTEDLAIISDQQLTGTVDAKNALTVITMTNNAAPLGTINNPYLVYDPQTLYDVRNDLGGYYLQTADIDLNVAPYNASPYWTPIGAVGTPFTGTFDGNGYTISNMYATSGGLFAIVRGATFKNISLVSPTVISNTGQVGALVGGIRGQSYGTYMTTFYNCNATNVLIDTTAVYNAATGGLVGMGGYGITYQYCFTTGSVSGREATGGLIGEHNINVHVSNCYSLCTVVGYYDGIPNHSIGDVGGLIGYTHGGYSIQKSEFINCYTGGETTGPAGSYGPGSAGLIGSASGGQVVVTNCYSSTKVNLPGRGLIGTISASSIPVTSSYWDNTINSDPTMDNGKGTPTSTVDMQTQATYSGWNFSTIRDIASSSYPTLQMPSYTPFVPGPLLTTINVALGTTVGGSELQVLSPIDVGEIQTLTINKLFSTAFSTGLYISSDDRWGCNINIAVNQQKATETI